MKKSIWAALTVAVALVSCAKEETVSTTAQSASARKILRPAFIDAGERGVADVRFSDSFLALVEQDLLDGKDVTKSAELNKAKQDLGILWMERIFPESPDFEAEHRAAGLHRWYRVHFRESLPVSKFADGLMAVGSGIMNVNPVLRAEVMKDPIFNDPGLQYQWHYINNTPGMEWASVNVLPVWENYTRGTEDVIVSVVDEGVSLGHPDLAANCIPGSPDGSQSFMPGATNPNTIDPGDHGTHVAGTIAAINNNGKGVCGLAGGDAAKGEKGVKILSCQVFKGDQGGNFADAIVWGADHGAVISQNSWGMKPVDENKQIDESIAREYYEFYIKPNDGQYADALKTAIDYFNNTAGMSKGKQVGPMAGGVVIFAAGNENLRYGAPACYPGAIAVGAIRAEDGAKASFSNYGDWVDIAAPGQNILSTMAFDDATTHEKYGYLDGTSMACPHVSGVAALVVSYFGGEGFTRQQLVDKLIGGANSTDFNVAANNIGPLVDVLGAIKYGTGNPPKPVTDATYSVKSNFITATFTVTADTQNPSDPAYGFRIYAAKSADALEDLNPIKPGADVIYGSALTGSRKIGDTASVTVEGLEFNTKYYVAVASYDYGRNFSQISAVVQKETLSNTAPLITVEHEGEIVVHSFETLAVPVTAEDPDGHKITVTNTPGSEYAKWSYNPVTDKYLLTVSGRNSTPGKYTATIKAEDPYGLFAEKQVKYQILPNQPPVIVKPFENMFFTQMGQKKSINLEDYIKDPDGESIAYTISVSNPGVVHVSQNGTKLTITALAESASATVTLTGADSGGESVSGSFGVLVRPEDVVAECYPNPVVSTLYVATGAESAEATINLYSATGSKVFGTTAACDAFHPAQIDMTYFAPGRYTLVVEYAGIKDSKTIIKR